MPPRVAVVDKAELLKRYLESNKPVYLDPGKLDVESVAIAAK